MTSLVFSTSSYDYLADRVCAASGWPRGEVERRRFPDGERYQRVVTDVADRDVVVIAGTVDEDATLELYDLASTIVQLGAGRLSLVIPFYGYSTMERAVRPGEAVVAKTRACLLSSIPAAILHRVFAVAGAMRRRSAHPPSPHQATCSTRPEIPVIAVLPVA